MFADNLLIYICRVLWRTFALLRTLRWPKTNANVLGAYVTSEVSWVSASVMYEYSVGDQKGFSDTFVKPFLFTSSAEAYCAKYTRGRSFTIRVNPKRPDISIADFSVENW